MLLLFITLNTLKQIYIKIIKILLIFLYNVIIINVIRIFQL